MARIGEKNPLIRFRQDAGYGFLKSISPILLIKYGTSKAHNKHRLKKDLPTVFMGNHDEGYNHIWAYEHIPYNIGKDLHAVVKAHIEMQNKAFRFILKHIAKAVFIERKDSQGIAKGEKNHANAYLNILKGGKNFIITPTGLTSIDGKVDYVEDDMPHGEEFLPKYFFRKVKNPFKIQYFFTMTDFVNDQPYISFGKPITKLEDVKTFKEHIADATIFTGLHILAYLQSNNSDLDLKSAIELLRLEGYTVVPKKQNAEHLADRTLVYRASVGDEGVRPLKVFDRKAILKKRGIKIPNQDSTTYQANQIEHMTSSLETVLGPYM